jgi:hypothetical protein
MKFKINWTAVRYRFFGIVPIKTKNFLAEVFANLLPRRVVGWVLFRACREYDYNQHITLYKACAKYTKEPSGRRGAV